MANAPQDDGEPESPASGSIEALFHSLESPLLHYAQRLTGTRSGAEDVVQEAFMRLHAHFDEVREPRPWLYRTVHNLAVTQRRKNSRIVELPPAASEEGTRPEPPDPLPLPDEQIARWEAIGQVRLCLETLDERSRTIVHLRFHENLSYRQIGQQTGLAVGHVGYLLHHALKTIAAELARAGGGR